MCEFAEANAAKVEVPHVATLPTAAEATVSSPSAELGLLLPPNHRALPLFVQQN